MRTSGILMPIFSLPSNGGIGTLGKEAYRFVDFLNKSGQSWWQILPLSPTNFGDSPYQSFSSYAGNPYFIDPEILIEEGLLTGEEFNFFDFGDNNLKIDYGKLYENRIKMLKIAFSRFVEDIEYKTFISDNAIWLDEYALFMALKNVNNDASWDTWENSFKFREEKVIAKFKEEQTYLINFYKFVQFKFFSQWFKLKAYANEKGIGIIGDIPIYVAYDSVDVWSEPVQFSLDKDLKPKAVAGCPPDYFSPKGQLWGNPLYNWPFMKRDSYCWWKRRMGWALKLYDVVRIDHFRGFESYWAIPFGEKTAENGKWQKGPNLALFNAIKKDFGQNLPIIAEDLGFLTQEVLKMVEKSGFPGMKVLQFAFTPDAESDYLPHNFNKNSVVYTGTHDNDTILGWAKTATKDELDFALKYMSLNSIDTINWAMMRTAMMSVADTCILTMQDAVGLDSVGRINTPSTLGDNWQWRIDGSFINDWLANILLDLTEISFRTPKI